MPRKIKKRTGNHEPLTGISKNIEVPWNISRGPKVFWETNQVIRDISDSLMETWNDDLSTWTLKYPTRLSKVTIIGILITKYPITELVRESKNLMGKNYEEEEVFNASLSNHSLLSLPQYYANNAGQ